MNEQSKKDLLEIARKSVSAAVRRQPAPQLQCSNPELAGHQGCFVTLKLDERLRGCLGNFISDIPLWKLVVQMAAASAIDDPRFLNQPLRPEDIPNLQIEISVLSKLERIANPMDIELGKHGIYIRRGGRAGCFLPQVAEELGWDKEQFLGYCCTEKAGLSWDAWKDPATEVLVFTAEVIEE